MITDDKKKGENHLLNKKNFRKTPEIPHTNFNRPCFSSLIRHKIKRIKLAPTKIIRLTN